MPRRTRARAARRPAIIKVGRAPQQRGGGVFQDAVDYARNNKGKIIAGTAAALALAALSASGTKRPTRSPYITRTDQLMKVPIPPFNPDFLPASEFNLRPGRSPYEWSS